MNWKFQLTKTAGRAFDRLDPGIVDRMLERLEWFVENFEETTSHPLTGEHKGFFKLRVGDWRIVYEVKETEQRVIVHAVDKRDKIYKRKI